MEAEKAKRIPRGRWALAVVVAIFFLIAIPCGFWISGFDFDRRGGIALSCYTLTTFSTIAAFFLTLTYPD